MGKEDEILQEEKPEAVDHFFVIDVVIGTSSPSSALYFYSYSALTFDYSYIMFVRVMFWELFKNDYTL